MGKRMPKSAPWAAMRELVIRVSDMNNKQSKVVTAKEFCKIFRCQPCLLVKWRSEGMPFIKTESGKNKYLYDVEKCHAWFRGEC